MNKPITLCDRCKEYARCALNYDGDNCRRNRTVEPTNADRIRSMTDEELAELLVSTDGDFPPNCEDVPVRKLEAYWLDWLRQEAGNG